MKSAGARDGGELREEDNHTRHHHTPHAHHAAHAHFKFSPDLDGADAACARTNEGDRQREGTKQKERVAAGRRSCQHTHLGRRGGHSGCGERAGTKESRCTRAHACCCESSRCHKLMLIKDGGRCNTGRCPVAVSCRLPRRLHVREDPPGGRRKRERRGRGEGEGLSEQRESCRPPFA